MTTPDSVLKHTFGFDAFRPGQREIVDGILQGQSVLAVMPTGAGKSLCYQVPSLIFDRPSIVVSPLVALMDNQVAALRLAGAPVGAVHSGQSREQNVEEWRKLARGEAKIFYLSPERLMSPRMLAAMDKINPAMFVVDEAHCVSKWGPAFRPEYDQLQDLKSRFPDAVIAAFTATADEQTREDIGHKLFGGQGKTVVQGFDRPNLDLTVLSKTDRKHQLLKLMENVKGQSGIVYCLSRKSTEETALTLRGAGYNALAYHAGMDAAVRFENQERFMAEEAVVMVATIAFGMGIDKPDIRFVFHMNLPGSLEAYYQEIGRAGRDGGEATTAMIYGLDDVRMRRKFISDDGSEPDHQIVIIVSPRQNLSTPRIRPWRCFLPLTKQDNGSGPGTLLMLCEALRRRDIAGYGALKITPAGRGVLERGDKFECKDIITETKKRRSGPSKTAALAAQLSHNDGELLKELKSLRMTLAREKAVPAYVIFSDASLMDMARKRPGSRSQMLDVSGVGDVKFDRYGQAFLDVIRAA